MTHYYGRTTFMTLFQAVEWLDICGRHGIILIQLKLEFGQTQIDGSRRITLQNRKLLRISSSGP